MTRHCRRRSHACPYASHARGYCRASHLHSFRRRLLATVAQLRDYYGGETD